MEPVFIMEMRYSKVEIEHLIQKTQEEFNQFFFIFYFYQLTDFLKDKDRARQILLQHVIVGELLMEDMANSTVFYTLQGSSAELQARVNQLRTVFCQSASS